MPDTFHLPNGRQKGRPLNPKGQTTPPQQRTDRRTATVRYATLRYNGRRCNAPH